MAMWFPLWLPMWFPLWLAMLLLVMASGAAATPSSEANPGQPYNPNVGIEAILAGQTNADQTSASQTNASQTNAGHMPDQDGGKQVAASEAETPKQPDTSEPGTPEPGTSEPGTSEPGTSEPVNTGSAETAKNDMATPAGAATDVAAGIGPHPIRQDFDPVSIDDLKAAAEARNVLPVKLRQAILLDPKVAEMSARACQMAHRLGLARAEGRPKITASLTGSRQIVGRIKKVPPVTERRFENGRIVDIREHGAEEIQRSGAHTREFDHREKNNIYDGKVTFRHTIADWGQRSSRAESRSLNWQAAQIDARVVMRERSHDLLQLSLTLRRSDAVIATLKANFDKVSAEVDAVRARVEAGAGRLSNHREAQLVLLDQ